MSLDNVIAIAAAAEGHIGLVIFGLLLSLPLVVWGSGFLAKLMNRWPWIVWIGGGVPGGVAMEMVLNDKFAGSRIEQWPHGVHVAISFAIAILITVLGWWFARRAARAVRDAVVS